MVKIKKATINVSTIIFGIVLLLVLKLSSDNDFGPGSVWHESNFLPEHIGEDYECGGAIRRYPDNRPFCGPSYESTSFDRYCAVETSGYYTNCYMEFEYVNGNEGSSDLTWKRGCRAVTEHNDKRIVWDSIKMCVARNGISAKDMFTKHYSLFPVTTEKNPQSGGEPPFEEVPEPESYEEEEITSENFWEQRKQEQEYEYQNPGYEPVVKSNRDNILNQFIEMILDFFRSILEVFK